MSIGNVFVIVDPPIPDEELPQQEDLSPYDDPANEYPEPEDEDYGF